MRRLAALHVEDCRVEMAAEGFAAGQEDRSFHIAHRVRLSGEFLGRLARLLEAPVAVHFLLFGRLPDFPHAIQVQRADL